MSTKYHILLIGLRSESEVFARKHFEGAGHRVMTAPGLREAEEILQDPELDLGYLQSLPGASGSEQLRRIAGLRPGFPVVVVYEEVTVAAALDAWHGGAADAVFFPLREQNLDSSMEQAARGLVSHEKRPIQARLRFLDETGKERWAPVVPPRFTIGRGSGNDLVFPHMNISRAQAEITVHEGEYLIRDLGSRHGTFVNGERIEQVKLNHGDRIELGGLQSQNLTFYTGDLLQSLLGSSSDSLPDVALSVRGFREMGMLLSTFRALSSIPLVDDLLALVVDTAIELTGAERGFIMLKDDKGELQFRCARNSYKRPLDGSNFRTSHRVPDEVFRTGVRAVINDLDVGDSPENHTTTRRLGVRSISCVPLRYLSFREAGNLSGIGWMETIGVLYVDSQNIAAQLSNTQIDALETLASEAAMAIYNARLYKESQEKRRLDEQLALARDIQQALLPEPNKKLPFVLVCSQNIPCYEVGGDYFDYFDLEDGRLGFALGDVAGKGMSAALLTAMLQGIFSAQTLFNLPPSEILSNVNRHLVRRGMGNRFVTFFFGILDPNGKCTYTNAGHNPPFYLGRDGSVRELTEGGMVLGLFPTAQYECGTVYLRPGDHLVLFTDGVIEARNKKGDEFGEERLLSLLQKNARATVPEILTRLREAVEEFSAGTPQHDDITMMVLGFQETESAPSLPVEAAQSLA